MENQDQPLAARIRTWIGVALLAVELVILVQVAVWTAVGAWSYATETDWKLTGLLTLLDEKWKGVLILAGLLFFRTVQEVLARTKKYNLPWGEMGEPLEPVEKPTVHLGRHPEKEPQ